MLASSLCFVFLFVCHSCVPLFVRVASMIVVVVVVVVVAAAVVVVVVVVAVAVVAAAVVVVVCCLLFVRCSCFVCLFVLLVDVFAIATEVLLQLHDRFEGFGPHVLRLRVCFFVSLFVCFFVSLFLSLLLCLNTPATAQFHCTPHSLQTKELCLSFRVLVNDQI